jgi:hypothetical protein
MGMGQQIKISYQNGIRSSFGSKEEGAESCCSGTRGAGFAATASSAALGWFLPKTEYCDDRTLTW